MGDLDTGGWLHDENLGISRLTLSGEHLYGFVGDQLWICDLADPLRRTVVPFEIHGKHVVENSGRAMFFHNSSQCSVIDLAAPGPPILAFDQFETHEDARYVERNDEHPLMERTVQMKDVDACAWDAGERRLFAAHSKELIVYDARPGSVFS